MKRFFSFLLLAAGFALQICSASPPHIVFMIGEDEYKTWETLPAFAQSELEPRGVKVTIVHSDPANKHNFPGLEKALIHADLLVLSVRRRAPAESQLAAVRAYLNAGKPLIGIRTASHAFAVRTDAASLSEAGHAQWPDFDPEVLGGNYSGHHGAGPTTALQAAPGAKDHPILKGFRPGAFQSQASLYRASPLSDSCTPLLMGSIPDKAPEPVAWTRLYGENKARVFYTSLGHPDDFENAEFRRLLLNALSWALQRPLTAQ